jgi:general transcription factor 3C polypeptide 3 (transcription factor C subunit 4)
VLYETGESVLTSSPVIDSRRRKPREASNKDQSQEPASMSLFEESGTGRKGKASIKSQNRLTPAELQKLEQQREAETKNGYMRVCQLWPTMMLPNGSEGQAEAEREWLVEAEKLVEMFRSTRNLFTTSKVSCFIPMFLRSTKVYLKLGFRGMIPTKLRRKDIAQEDEDEMASRLHLNLGKAGVYYRHEPC